MKGSATGLLMILLVVASAPRAAALLPVPALIDVPSVPTLGEWSLLALVLGLLGGGIALARRRPRAGGPSE